MNAPIRQAVLVFALVAGAPVGADVVYRVKDLRTVPPPGDSTVHLGPIGAVGGRIVFSAVTPSLGSEPWMTDGTEAGTRLLRDLLPGSGYSMPQFGVPVPGALLFTAVTPGTGRELWWTDGSAEGTRLVFDILPGHRDSDPLPIGTIGGAFYFSADDGVHGRELWRSNGTAAGTRMVEDIRPGAEGGLATHDSADGANLNHRIFFAANDGVHGVELWRTDGTEDGTYQLKNIATSGQSSTPRGFASVGGRLYFSAWQPGFGRELWSSDGSASGTMMTKDVCPGGEDSDPSTLIAYAGRYFFRADDGIHGRELWVSDGSAAGTRLLRDFRPGADGSYFANEAGGVGSRIVFGADDGVHGLEPWSSDGTVDGTTLLGDLFPGLSTSYAEGFGRGLDGVVFTAKRADGEYWLWRSDGTPQGTGLISPIEGWPGSSRVLGGVGPKTLVALYYEGFRYSHSRLWVTDGTAAGSREVLDFVPPRSSSGPGPLVARAGGILLGATADDGRHSFVSDGSEIGTVPVRTPQGGFVDPPGAGVTLPDGSPIFTTWGSFPSTLWRADDEVATPLGIFGTAGVDPFQLVQVDDAVYFVGGDPSTGAELWSTDGSPAGTVLVHDIFPGPSSSSPRELVAGIDRVWFWAWDEAHGRELWESSGTPPTTFLHDLVPGPPPASSDEVPLVPLSASSELVIFETSERLHVFDTATGAVQTVHTFSPEFVFVRALVPHLGALYFFDLDAEGRCSLWRSNGTAAGTTRLRITGRGPGNDPCPNQLASLGGRLFFNSCTAATGCEMWVSDGTSAGTRLFADLEPGFGSFLPTALSRVGSRLYFSGCRIATGCEPWVTDGSVAGTHRLGDIWPGPRSALWSTQSYYHDDWMEFTESDDLVYFAADDGTGAELWAAPIEVFYDGFEGGDLSRWD